MQSGFWKQRIGSSLRATWCLVVAVACLSGINSRAQVAKQAASKGIITETQLNVETKLQADRLVSTFTIHVEPTAGEDNASGIVTLVDGARQIGSSVLDQNGDAKVQVNDLLPGRHFVHALYAGTNALAPSLSPAAEVTAAVVGVPDFSVNPAQTSLSVTQGNAVITILTLSPLNNFSGYVTLSCSNLPQYTTCGFVPVNVFIGQGKNSTSTLSIVTQAPTGPNVTQLHSSRLIYAFIFPGIIGLAGLGMRGRRHWQQAGMVLLVLTSIGAMSGCSQRYDYLKRQPAPLTGTPTGTSNFILEEQSISGSTVIAHQTTMTLTVTAPAS